MKLGTLLLRDAAISLDALESALRNQVLYGGRLGTNLVEIGALDLESLTRYLSRLHNVPAATAEQFANAPAPLLEAFAPMAEQYAAFPLGPSEHDANVIALALVDPANDEAVTQIGKQLARTIERRVAPELRVLYHLEHHYGITRKPRFVRTGNAKPSPQWYARAVPASDGERRRAQPAGGMEAPPPVRLEPRRRRTSSGRARRDSSSHAIAVSIDQAVELLGCALERDDVGDVFDQYVCGRFGAAALLVVRERNASVWRWYCAHGAKDPPALERLSLPLGGASVFECAFDSKETYRGPPPSAGRPVERRLWGALGLSEEPEMMVVMPIVLRDRVVNLIYAHGRDFERISEQRIAELERFADAITAAYIALIRRTKI